jgi:hypothetical protein
MKFEVVDVKPPEDKPWQKLEKELLKLPVGKDLKVSDISKAEMKKLSDAIGLYSKLKITVTKEGDGYRVAIAGHKGEASVLPPTPPAPVGTPAAAAPAPQPQAQVDTSHKGKTFTVSSLGTHYIKELSALANKLGAVRVPKSLFKERGKRAIYQALMQWRKLGHNVDARAQKKSKSLLIPRAGTERVVLRKDRVGVWFGSVKNRMEALTRPDSQPAPVKPVSLQVTAPPRLAHGHATSAVYEPRKPDSIKIGEPMKFPTGNRCFVCIGNGQSVCGDTSSFTYKGVKICRVHMNLLRKGAVLYARPKITRGQMLLKK